MVRRAITALVALAFCANLPRLQAQVDPLAWKLAGIAVFDGSPIAIWQNPVETRLLRERQRSGQIEIVKIMPKTAAVEAIVGGRRIEFKLKSQTNFQEGFFTVALEHATLGTMLTLHQDSAGLVLLRHPLLPDTEFTLTVLESNRAGVARSIERSLAAKDIAIQPDGRRFLKVAPKRMRLEMSDSTPSVFERTAKPTGPTININWPHIPIRQLAEFYASVVEREFPKGEKFPALTRPDMITFNGDSLTAKEYIHAMDVLFGWAGIKIVPEGERFLKVFPIPIEEPKERR
jgi:hypothetical protein